MFPNPQISKQISLCTANMLEIKQWLELLAFIVGGGGGGDVTFSTIEGRRKEKRRKMSMNRSFDESFSFETETSCVRFNLSSITPRTLLAKNAAYN